jgi:hypothetical protein
VKFIATKKGMTTNFFSPFSFIAVFGSGIRDPRSGIREGKKSGSGIRDKYHGSATLVRGHGDTEKVISMLFPGEERRR